MRLYLASVSYHLLLFVCEGFVSPLHIAKHVYSALICLLYQFIRGIEKVYNIITTSSYSLYLPPASVFTYICACAKVAFARVSVVDE